MRGTESGTLKDAGARIKYGMDDDLASIVEAWPMLADDVKRTIAGVVRLSILKR